MSLRLVAVVLAPFAGGYFLSYMYRAINAVVAPNLASDLNLDAASIGLITAAYLIAFALFQLPLGILLDRFGPRRVQTALLLTAASGSALFAVADSAVGLAAARALIGLGFAGGLMAGFKAVVLWFHPSRHALANACIMSVGGLGMLAATLPAELAVQTIGWRAMFLWASIFTALIAALIFFVVPEPDGDTTPAPLRQQLADIGTIYRDRFFWRLAPLVATTAGGHIGIHTLWAGPWFRDISGLDRDGVAWYLLLIGVAFLVGTLLGGIVADWLGRRGIDQMHVMVAGLGIFIVSQVGIVAEATSLNLVIWTAFGMTGQMSILAYPALAKHFGMARSARAQTSLNLLLFLTAFASQSIIGAIIDKYPQTATSYSPEGYRMAFGVMLVAQILAAVWYFAGHAKAVRTAND
ncbi:MAG: MFS transporter [Chromatiales bacterium]|jgi:predicted MFS family arabinose efflux permease|nr:MFS transporter [Chromatiales bacterium]